jgi:Tol biopolymer transport system component
LIPLRGGEARQLLGESERAADWSADGTQLLYTIGTTAADAAVRSLTDGSTRRLTQTPDGEFNVRWTADGEHVVFMRETPRRQIVTVDVGSLTGR